MATGTIFLSPGSAILPDGTASNAAPAIQLVKSSASAPGPYFRQLAFDATTREQVTFQAVVPANFASAFVAVVHYKMASATTGGVAWEVRLAAISDGDAADVDAKAFGSANTGTASVPGTAGHPDEVSISLTNADSAAAGDLLFVYLARAVADGADTATGDAEVTMLELRYTTT